MTEFTLFSTFLLFLQTLQLFLPFTNRISTRHIFISRKFKKTYTKTKFFCRFHKIRDIISKIFRKVNSKYFCDTPLWVNNPIIFKRKKPNFLGIAPSFVFILKNFRPMVQKFFVVGSFRKKISKIEKFSDFKSSRPINILSITTSPFSGSEQLNYVVKTSSR